MKRSVLFLSVCSLMFFMSCKNDVLSLFTEDDASEVIASSLSEDAGGLSNNLKYSAKLSEEIYPESKREELFDTTFTLENTTGVRYTYSYSFHFSYGIRYNTEKQIFEFYTDFDTDGHYRSSRIYSEDASQGSLVMTGLESSEDSYTISCECSRTGSQDTKFRESMSISSTIDFELVDLTMRKSDYVIINGGGTVKIYGKTDEGKDFSYEGSLEYNNGTVILTINGTTYTIETDSGIIS